jgi:hypothetical protein
MANFIHFLILTLIRILSHIPFFKGKNRIIRILNRQKSKIVPTLFDDIKFLTYVYKKKIALENSANKITTIGLRASTTDYSFYSPIWDGAFNLGLTSSDLFSIYHLYDIYRNKLPNLKNIIIFFSVCAPGYELIKTSEKYRAVTYNYFFHIPYNLEKEIKPKYIKRIVRKCAEIKVPDLDPFYNGYELQSYFGVNISAEDRFRTHYRENQRDPDQMYWLKSLIEKVTADNRRLIVIIPPVRSDYKKILPQELSLYEKLLNLNLTGLEIISYFDSELFNDSDFGDVDHLNENGAIKITNDLKSIFEKRFWI